MKTFLKILLTIALSITVWYQANAQTFQGQKVKFDIDKWNITATANLSPDQVGAFFKFMDQAVGRNLKDRYLITPSGTYYRAGLSRKQPKKL
jgi:hypothetical protein